jgi:hypothetical protein
VIATVLVTAAALGACGGRSVGSLAVANCAPIDLTGAPYVTATLGTGGGPAMTGGQIVPGDYVLMSATSYAPGGTFTSGSATPLRQVIHIDSSTMTSDMVDEASDDGGQEFIFGTTYTVSGNAIHWEPSCNNTGESISRGQQMLSETYAATPTSITLSVDETSNSPSPVAVYLVEEYQLR